MLTSPMALGRNGYQIWRVLLLYGLCVGAWGQLEPNNNLKINVHGLELTQAQNIQRQEVLQKMCDSLSGANSLQTDDLTEQQMEHLLVDRKHHFLYCYVPKVACTNWKRVLMILTDAWNGTEPLQIPANIAHSPGVFVKFSALSEAEKAQVLADYTRFIVTRHPFERLLSAYRNKLEGNLPSAQYFQARVGRQIVKHFRPNASNASLGNDVTFSEFAQYLLTPELSMNYQANQSFNEHWEPITNLCNPCFIKYNVIGKYETLIEDSALALQIINATVTFPAGQRTSGTSERMRTYFDTLPIGTLRGLYQLYENDFKLFGYSLDDVLGFELG
uniref:Carbohydrate sulfotransferase n=1 Tax=Phlebotomus kandelakii TaxID=1109342 RepID=A0A6B2E7X2_9DIPT